MIAYVTLRATNGVERVFVVPVMEWIRTKEQLGTRSVEMSWPGTEPFRGDVHFVSYFCRPGWAQVGIA